MAVDLTDAGAPADLDSFRQRARSWLAENAPPDDREEASRSDDEARWAEARRFQAAQHAAGFAGIAWPERYGGQGLTPAHQAVFNEEAAPYALPSSAFDITIAILGMTLLDHGTEEQKQRYLPEMLRGEALWVQLLSEPGAGSDLAAVRMRAEPDGDDWVLNGEKVWSTHAQWSDYAMVLARTDWDVPKHAGLTMFIVPFDVPGMTVLPLRQLSGDDEFCQEFLDDVRVPAAAVLGGVGRGWPVATSLFNHSRNMTAGAGVTGPVYDRSRGGDPEPGRDLIEHVNAAGLAGDAAVRQLVAEVVVDNIVSGLLAARIAADPQAHPVAGTMAKLFGAVTVQRRCEIDLELRGESAIAWHPGDTAGATPAHSYLNGRTASVAGGTHEVMKNAIGERILGLPREPAVDRDRPFRDVIRGATDQRDF